MARKADTMVFQPLQGRLKTKAARPGVVEHSQPGLTQTLTRSVRAVHQPTQLISVPANGSSETAYSKLEILLGETVLDMLEEGGQRSYADPGKVGASFFRLYQFGLDEDDLADLTEEARTGRRADPFKVFIQLCCRRINEIQDTTLGSKGGAR